METNATSQSQQHRAGAEEYEFQASVGQMTVLGSLLKSIAFTPKVNVAAIPSRGLRFTVEEGKYVQASVTINQDLFDEFSISSESDDISFKIPFKELLDCLKFLGSDGKSELSTSTTAVQGTTTVTNSSLKLLYKAFGYPLKLILDENVVTTDFEIKTEPYDIDLMDFELDGAAIMCKLILGSEYFSDLLNEFDSNNPGTIRIGIIPGSEMRLTCDGVAGLMTASIPSNSMIVQLFESISELHVTYKFSTLRSSFRAMNMSQTMSLKIDSNGVLRLTYLMPTKTDSFVEFFILPNAMDEEEAGFPLE